MNDTNSRKADMDQRPGSTESRAVVPVACVFEIVEQNAVDENYFTHGIFLSLEDAVAVVDARGVHICHDPQEYARVEIRQRSIGLDDTGKAVWERAWEVDYDTDSFNRWRVVPASRSAATVKTVNLG